MRDLCKKITERNKEDKAFRQWLALLPAMAMKMIKFIEYEDFKVQIIGQQIDLRPDEEILEEVRQVREEIEGHEHI